MASRSSPTAAMPLAELPHAQPGVDEDARLFGGQQRGVSRTAARQHAEFDDGAPPGHSRIQRNAAQEQNVAADHVWPPMNTNERTITRESLRPHHCLPARQDAQRRSQLVVSAMQLRQPAMLWTGMRLLPVLLFGYAAFAQDQVVVRALKFEHFQGCPAKEILDRLKEREVRLAVEKPYRPDDAEEARQYIAELLAEKGRPNARIEVATKIVAPRRVEVRFSC